MYLYLTLFSYRSRDRITKFEGVVGCGKSVVYFASLGRLTDIGLQLDKACYPCSR